MKDQKKLETILADIDDILVSIDDLLDKEGDREPLELYGYSNGRTAIGVRHESYATARHTLRELIEESDDGWEEYSIVKFREVIE